MSERFVIDPKHVAEHHKLKPSIDDVYGALGDDPAKYLFAFLAMARSPMRKQLGFQRADLQWLERAWNEAATAVPKGRLHDACLFEARRYRGLHDDLVSGEMERREEGIVFLSERGDWPHVNVIKAAITALTHAGIRSLQ